MRRKSVLWSADLTFYHHIFTNIPVFNNSKRIRSLLISVNFRIPWRQHFSHVAALHSFREPLKHMTSSKSFPWIPQCRKTKKTKPQSWNRPLFLHGIVVLQCIWSSTPNSKMYFSQIWPLNALKPFNLRCVRHKAFIDFASATFVKYIGLHRIR